MKIDTITLSTPYFLMNPHFFFHFKHFDEKGFVSWISQETLFQYHSPLDESLVIPEMVNEDFHRYYYEKGSFKVCIGNNSYDQTLTEISSRVITQAVLERNREFSQITVNPKIRELFPGWLFIRFPVNTFLHKQTESLTHEDIEQLYSLLPEKLHAIGIDVDPQNLGLNRLDLPSDVVLDQEFTHYHPILPFLDMPYHSGKMDLEYELPDHLPSGTFYLGNGSRQICIYDKTKNNAAKHLKRFEKNTVRFEYRLQKTRAVKKVATGFSALSQEWAMLETTCASFWQKFFYLDFKLENQVPFSEETFVQRLHATYPCRTANWEKNLRSLLQDLEEYRQKPDHRSFLDWLKHRYGPPFRKLEYKKRLQALCNLGFAGLLFPPKLYLEMRRKVVGWHPMQIDGIIEKT